MEHRLFTGFFTLPVRMNQKIRFRQMHLKKDEMPAAVQELFSQLDRNPDSMGLRLRLIDALDSLGAYNRPWDKWTP
jgi:hypothetical protein